LSGVHQSRSISRWRDSRIAGFEIIPRDFRRNFDGRTFIADSSMVYLMNRIARGRPVMLSRVSRAGVVITRCVATAGRRTVGASGVCGFVYNNHSHLQTCHLRAPEPGHVR
jgi:hypothetical protein